MKRNLLAGLMALIVLVSVVMFSGCVEEEVSTRPAATTPSVTSTPASTLTATPAPRGSYQNPADISETVILKSGGNTLEVTVLEVERGEKVWEELYAANMFNDEPKQGFEYLLAKIRVAYISGESSTYVSDSDFKAYAEGVGCDRAWQVLPDDKPEFEGVDLLPGGQTEGWICFEVPKNKEVLIAYESLFDLEPRFFINVGS
ncbi:MAG TPA: DUF4352 domain-containing protein [Deltaproteobacteria bacterium]|nr:DUF4352 domain-containing protein [Deltaproteobacteria bacterium]